ncbi:hypothetical protein ACEWY4_021138 [Coilia grayii]|uniref:YqgF/RNase H-like domain-containing protein n=1 Tax=Coilia grayii TaxID=363190 RepID=A0ABD1J9V7_9TELE
MIRRAKTAKVYIEVTTDDEDKQGDAEDDSDDNADDSWHPEQNVSNKKSVARKPAKPREPKPKKEPKPKREPKPKAERKPRAPRVPKGKNKEPPTDAPTVQQPEPQIPAAMEAGASSEREGPQEPLRVKEERLSFPMPISCTPSGSNFTSSTNQQSQVVKKEEPEEDFTFDEPAVKKQKTSTASQGSRPIRQAQSVDVFGEGLHMNWDPIQVLAQRTGVEQWVCVNVAQLLREENTIPFLVRYRKQMINYMDADALREVQVALEELCGLAKKCQSVIQTLKKDGVLTSELEVSLKNCRTPDELDHVYSPYKKGSKLSKARRAKELGLEPVALALLQNPQTLNLHSYVKPGTEGLSTIEEVATGVEQILAHMIAKDTDTLNHVRSLCDRSAVMLESSVSKTALKEQQQQQQRGGEQKSKPKDIDKFQLYSAFSCSIHRVQPHQTLAINRGENLKILTVKVKVPDAIKNDFSRWCVNVRWRPKGFAQPELMKILLDAVEDSYKRLILPLLCRGYRTKLTAVAEKESVAMFVRNLRQRLLTCPVRGRAIMGVDPGYRHGCKLAILSSVGQILHTDVVYLHSSGGKNEAGKLRHLLLKYSCQTVVIGNGTACRETEAFFADLIKQRFFQPLDVSYW